MPGSVLSRMSRLYGFPSLYKRQVAPITPTRNNESKYSPRFYSSPYFSYIFFLLIISTERAKGDMQSIVVSHYTHNHHCSSIDVERCNGGDLPSLPRASAWRVSKVPISYHQQTKLENQEQGQLLNLVFNCAQHKKRQIQSNVGPTTDARVPHRA